VGEACAASTALFRPDEPHPTPRRGQDGWRLTKDAWAAGEGVLRHLSTHGAPLLIFCRSFTPLASDQSGLTCKAAEDS